nr:transposase (putative), gypsy type [Tanacetum cinerariifolium]
MHPRFPDFTFTMDRLPSDAIGIYYEFLQFSGVRVPFLTFLLSVLKYFKGIGSPFLNVRIRRTFAWMMGSSLKKWKRKFFLIDRRAIPNHLTWRHSHSCVSDDLPADGYNRSDVEQLRAHLICFLEMKEEAGGYNFYAYSSSFCRVLIFACSFFAEMSIYDFMTLPSWDDAKIVEEPHYLSEPLLEHRACEGGCFNSFSYSRRGCSCSAGPAAASVPAPHLGKRLGPPPAMAIASVSEPAYVGTSSPAFTSGRSLALGGSSIDGFVGKSEAENIRKALDRTITPAELRRTKSLLPLEFSNRLNVLSALLVSHGYELNPCYTDWLHLRDLRSQRDVASKEVKKLQSQLDDVKATSVGLTDELAHTDAKLSEQALTARDLQNELASKRLTIFPNVEVFFDLLSVDILDGGIHSCTSRSHYQSISKQTTRGFKKHLIEEFSSICRVSALKRTLPYDIQEEVERGIVELFFIGTEYQLAGLFTKALLEDKFKYLVRRLGMRCLTPEELEVLENEYA